MPKVSIIIPVYNVSDYIERCIRSVINQTYQDIECVIVNDCTPDDSIKKCEKLLEKYNGPIQFVLLNHEKNRGLSAARNTGTAKSSGEYIYYLDSDDDITSDCISCLLEIVGDDSSIDMVQGNYVEYRGDRQDIYYKGKMPPSIIGNEMVCDYMHKGKGLAVTAWNKLIRHSFLTQHNISFKEGLIHEDELWMFFMKKYLQNVRLTPQVTYHYYVRPNSIMTGVHYKKMKENKVKLFREILGNLMDGREKKELEDYVGVFCSLYLAYGKPDIAFYELFNMYKTLSLRYHAWYAYIVLSIVKMMNIMEINIKTLDKFVALRVKLINTAECFKEYFKRKS